MCNRYTLVDPKGAFVAIARILGVSLTPPVWVKQRYNIALTQIAPTVVNRGAGPEVLPMHFGLFRKHNPNMLTNARSETVYTKRSFKDLAPAHRCAVPASGFIDWQTDEDGRKWPFHFTMADDRPMALAALWGPPSDDGVIPPGYVIVTSEPNEVVARMHDRMPVILRDEHLGRWLDPAPMAEPEFLEIAEKLPAEAIRAQEVSDYANSSKHEGPECLAPPKPRGAQLGFGF